MIIYTEISILYQSRTPQTNRLKIGTSLLAYKFCRNKFVSQTQSAVTLALESEKDRHFRVLLQTFAYMRQASVIKLYSINAGS